MHEQANPAKFSEEEVEEELELEPPLALSSAEIAVVTVCLRVGVRLSAFCCLSG